MNKATKKTAKDIIKLIQKLQDDYTDAIAVNDDTLCINLHIEIVELKEQLAELS